MEAMVMLLFIATVTGLIFLSIFYWAWKSGQFENLDGPAHRILHDDDDLENFKVSSSDKKPSGS
ncbi:MAG: cbb3-type cytochrome oxidase assembly protein CcoS [Leptospiraceae bacterium]|nr:cbb3-type cytochrome oxidase assembly protein CcoS [Leptospiraceae bacterium]